MDFDKFIYQKYDEFKDANFKSVRKISTKIKEGDRTGKDIKEAIEKIQNFSDIWGINFDDIVDGILSNDIIAAKFSKDPKKQNLSEKSQKEFLEKRGLVIDKLPAGGKNNLRLLDGEIITGENKTAQINGKKCTKSIDFLRENDYIYAKWTEISGGAQDNQFNEVIGFLIEAHEYVKKHNDGKRFVALLDGKLYKSEQSKEQLLTYVSDRVIITDSDNYK